MLPIDPARLGTLVGLDAVAKLEFETRAQKHNPAGVPLWTVSAYCSLLGEVLKVTVPSSVPIQVTPGAAIDFIGLVAGVYSSGNRAAWYFAADEVTA